MAPTRKKLAHTARINRNAKGFFQWGKSPERNRGFDKPRRARGGIQLGEGREGTSTPSNYSLGNFRAFPSSTSNSTLGTRILYLETVLVLSTSNS
jgi:hypothetical protein